MKHESLTDAAEQRFPSLMGIGSRRQRRREIVRLVAIIDDEMMLHEFTTEEALVERVLCRAHAEKEFGFSPILVIIIGELVSWLVKRILERWFPQEDDSGRDAASPPG